MDPILLTLYLLSIAYCLQRIINAFNDEFVIKLDNDLMNQQLTAQQAQDILDISFGFDKRYEFDKLKQFGVNVKNKSDNHSIYVDWDCCTVTDLGDRARRVTRLPPGTTLDLYQNQVFSTVAPKTTLKETITAEDILKRKGDNLEYEIASPLLDPGAMRKNTKFMKRYADLNFSFKLAVRLVGPSRHPSSEQVHVLCKFSLKKLPWTAGLPWNPK
jgi:hypothetical protein